MRALLPALAALCALPGCDIDARPLLQNFQDGEIQGAQVLDLDQLEDPPALESGTFRGNLGPSDIGQGDFSGATFTIEGTGGRICVIVDPQSVFRDDEWIDDSGGRQANPFMFDFPHDDGDVDLQVGLAAFYTGTPGERMGDFVNSFPDENGVERRVDLNLCLMQDTHGQVGGSAGRATPEWCSFETTEGTDYRVVLTVFSVPTDDNLLRYALEVRDGACPDSIDECTLRGDYDDRPDVVLPEGFDNVEDMYCGGPLND